MRPEPSDSQPSGTLIAPSIIMQAREQLARMVRSRVFLFLIIISISLDATSVVGNAKTQSRLYRTHAVSASHFGLVLVQLGFGSLLFAAIIGALIPLTEFRDRTIGRTVLFARGPRRLVSGQLVASLVLGALFGLTGAATSTVAALICEHINNVPTTWSGGVLASIVGVVAVSLLAAPWGVALGWIGRHMTGTLAAIVVYTLAVEGAINAVAPGVWKWLPGGAQAAIYRDATTTHLGQLAGVFLFLGWLAVAGGAAVWRWYHGDLL